MYVTIFHMFMMISVNYHNFKSYEKRFKGKRFVDTSAIRIKEKNSLYSIHILSFLFRISNFFPTFNFCPIHHSRLPSTMNYLINRIHVSMMITFHDLT